MLFAFLKETRGQSHQTEKYLSLLACSSPQFSVLSGYCLWTHTSFENKQIISSILISSLCLSLSLQTAVFTVYWPASFASS